MGRAAFTALTDHLDDQAFAEEPEQGQIPFAHWLGCNTWSKANADFAFTLLVAWVNAWQEAGHWRDGFGGRFARKTPS